MNKEMGLEEQLISYLDRRKAFMEIMDSTQANVYVDKTFEVVEKIWKQRDRGLSIFLRLINHSNPYVVLTSAQGLLPVDEPLGIEVLEGLTANDVPEISALAEIVLDQWKSGELEYLRSMGDSEGNPGDSA